MISTKQYKTMYFKKVFIVSLLLSFGLLLYNASKYYFEFPTDNDISNIEKKQKGIERVKSNIEQTKIIINKNKNIEEKYEKMGKLYLLDPEALEKELKEISSAFVKKYSFVDAIDVQIEPSKTFINAALVKMTISGLNVAEMVGEKEQEIINIASATLVKNFIKSHSKFFSYYRGTLSQNKNIVEYTFIKDNK